MYISNSNLEITRREVLFSIIIFIILLMFGFFLHNKIIQLVEDDNEYYYKALKIDNDKEMFDYGMETSVGNSLVYGEIKSVDKVSFEELASEYMIISKHKERYTKHTRKVSHTRTKSNGKTETYYTTETYYSWDSKGTEIRKSSQIKFLENIYPFELISMSNSSKYLTLNSNTINEKYTSKISNNYIYEDSNFFNSVGDLRWYYTYTPTTLNGTMYVSLYNKTITNPTNVTNIYFYANNTIQDIISAKESKAKFVGIGFWIGYALLMIVLIVLFYYIDNKWLED